jgi:hypothetical protein
VQLQVHRRAPEDIGRRGACQQVSEVHVIEIVAVHVLIAHLDPRIERLKVIDQRSGDANIRGRMNDELSLLFRRSDDCRVLRRIARGHLTLRRKSDDLLGRRLKG